MRISYIAVGLLSFALIVGLCSSASASQMSAQSQTSATLSQGAAAQGAAPAQSAPPQATPQTSTTPGTTPEAAHAPAQAPDDNPLNLTEEQQAKLRPILSDEQQQMEAVRNDTSMTTEQKMAKVQQIRNAAGPKIKAVLTPEQIQKISVMQKQRQEQQQSAPPAGTPPPQR